jgi:hypothetical protein
MTGNDHYRTIKFSTFQRCPTHVYGWLAGFVYFFVRSLPLQNGEWSFNYDLCATSVKFG